MRPILYTLFFAAFLFLASCEVPAYVTVPVEYTPRAYFRKKDSTRIVVVNQFNADLLNIASKRKLASIKAGAYTAIKSAALQLGSLPRVKTIIAADSANFKPDTDSVKFIAEKYKADYVLVLKKFGADIGLTEISNATSYYDTNVSVNFLLYAPDGIFYKKLNGQANDPHSEQPYEGIFAELIFHPTVGGNKASVRNSAEHAVQSALQDYFPYTISHSRPLFNDDFLKPSVAAIMAQDYDKADSLLQKLMLDKNPEVLSKAAYNLAVVYEALGDISMARDFATESNEKKKNEFATAILYDLKQE
ncbi:MAG TPA: DUF6340 family protein [Mucilaginibacter sp.]